MSEAARRMLLWSPRILGISVAVFLGTFALDAVYEGVVAFVIHLVPALFLLIVVAVSWRWQWVGGVVFVGLALTYALTTLNRVDWILTISGPLLVVGLLFLWSWRHHRALRDPS